MTAGDREAEVKLSEPSVRPGWYRDAAHPGKARWWDGVRWTDNWVDDPSYAVAPTAAPASSPPKARQASSRRRLSPLAIVLVAVAALVLVGGGTVFGVGALLAPTVVATTPQSPAAVPVETPKPSAPEATTESGEEPLAEAPPAKSAASAEAVESAAIPVVEATVVRVVDGDTAVFKLKGGKTEKTRFIGIDTPESTNSIEAYGREAAVYTKQSLYQGRVVYLELGLDKRDKYDRLLAYVWLSRPSDGDRSEVRNKMFNAELALAGYAQQMTIQPNSKYADYFREFVAEARDGNAGLWGAQRAEPEPEPEAATPAPAAVAPAPSSGASYICNSNTRKFHHANCSSVDDMSEKNKVPMDSREDAVRAGYVPCKRCNP